MKLKFLCGVMVAIAAMAGCSTKESADPNGEIRLGVADATRAAVNSTMDLVAIGGNIGIYGIKTATHETPGVWTDAEFSERKPAAGGLVMNNVRTTSIDGDGSMHWEGKYYYPFDANSGVQFYAYHPYDAAITPPTAGISPVSSFTIDGTTDVMYTAPAIGWRTGTAGETQLKFKHALTQLTFALSDPEKNFEGCVLESIVITGVNTTGKLDVATGATSKWSTRGALTLQGIPEDGVVFTKAAWPAPEGYSKQELKGSVIMLQPGLASIVAEVTVNGRKANITIRPDAPAFTFEAGKSYKITLTFMEMVAIGVKAEVQAWIEGGVGFAEVY